MNGRHFPVSYTANFLCHFDQDKYSFHNIDRNNHTEERGETDDDDYDDDHAVAWSSDKFEEEGEPVNDSTFSSSNNFQKHRSYAGGNYCRYCVPYNEK